MKPRESATASDSPGARVKPGESALALPRGSEKVLSIAVQTQVNCPLRLAFGLLTLSRPTEAPMKQPASHHGTDRVLHDDHPR